MLFPRYIILEMVRTQIDKTPDIKLTSKSCGVYGASGRLKSISRSSFASLRASSHAYHLSVSACFIDRCVLRTLGQGQPQFASFPELYAPRPAEDMWDGNNVLLYPAFQIRSRHSLLPTLHARASLLLVYYVP